MRTLSDKLQTFVLFLALTAATVAAQEPTGYYKSAEGLKQKALLQELCDIVGPHTNVGYDGLWEVYKDSDVRPGTNYYWDMYSTSKFRVGQNKCGNYSNVGDCVNREHSFPKSWFDDRSPMVSDAFHIYPTDGKVNGQRSNYPFGECERGTTLPSHNGVSALGKLGTSTFPGYSGQVFEPDDEYKGDFARTYFYMAACYNDKIASWSSPMLAGNNYPCYKTWAVNLLMKWNEQDPVSQKEIDRNNAVYKHQKNRNPFIDHPELADHIWGDKQNVGWIPGGVVEPKIAAPYNGSTVDLGVTATGKTLSKTVEIRSQGLTKDLTVSVSGTGFAVSATTVSAATANAGTTITVSYSSSTETVAAGSLSISNGEAATTVGLKAQAVDGIPALPASNVTADSFTANWTDVDNDGGYYTLAVTLANGTALPGYPTQVAAAAGKHTVTGLDYSTDYLYSLTNAAGKPSNTVSVRTADPHREISFSLPEGGLQFSAKPGEDSEPLAVTVFSENVEEETINVAVTGNFRVSLDKSDWKTALEIYSKDTETAGVRLYVCMPASQAGSYSGSLSASTATVEGADSDISGVVTEPVTFFEDFEATSTLSGYTGGEYEGTACRWLFTKTGIYGRSGDKFNGDQAACTDKNGSGASIAMLSDKQDGAGRVSFLAAPYGSDAASTVTLYYSVDDGASWVTAGTFTAEKSALTEFTADVNIPQPVRFKFEVTGESSGNHRVNIDDVKITSFSQSGVELTPENGWDAYCAGGQLKVELGQPAEITVYAIDARQVYAAKLQSGDILIPLPAGCYIVVNGNDSRTVIVR